MTHRRRRPQTSQTPSGENSTLNENHKHAAAVVVSATPKTHMKKCSCECVQMQFHVYFFSLFFRHQHMAQKLFFIRERINISAYAYEACESRRKENPFKMIRKLKNFCFVCFCVTANSMNIQSSYHSQPLM
jgi:hypothetical protein